MVGETKKEAIKTKKEAVKTKTSSYRGNPVPTGSRDGRIVVPGTPGTHGEPGRAVTPSNTHRPRVTAHPSHTTVGTGCPR